MATHIDYVDAHSRPARIDPVVLDEPGLRLLVQLTPPALTRSGPPPAPADPLFASRAGTGLGGAGPLRRPRDQGDPDELFDHIERAAGIFDRLGRPSPGRIGVTAGPQGQAVWLDSPATPVVQAVGGSA